MLIAKSLQSCPTLCDPIDGSPPGSPIPGILQARTLEWVAISFSNAWKWKAKVQSCPTLSHPMDCSPPGSSIHGIFQARVLEWGAIASERIKPESRTGWERAGGWAPEFVWCVCVCVCVYFGWSHLWGAAWAESGVAFPENLVPLYSLWPSDSPVLKSARTPNQDWREGCYHEVGYLRLPGVVGSRTGVKS